MSVLCVPHSYIPSIELDKFSYHSILKTIWKNKYLRMLLGLGIATFLRGRILHMDPLLHSTNTHTHTHTHTQTHAYTPNPQLFQTFVFLKHF